MRLHTIYEWFPLTQHNQKCKRMICFAAHSQTEFRTQVRLLNAAKLLATALGKPGAFLFRSTAAPHSPSRNLGGPALVGAAVSGARGQKTPRRAESENFYPLAPGLEGSRFPFLPSFTDASQRNRVLGCTDFFLGGFFCFVLVVSLLPCPFPSPLPQPSVAVRDPSL